MNCRALPYLFSKQAEHNPVQKGGPWKLCWDPAPSRFFVSLFSSSSHDLPLLKKLFHINSSSSGLWVFGRLRRLGFGRLCLFGRQSWYISYAKEQANGWLSRCWSMMYPCKVLEGPCSFTGPLSSHSSLSRGTLPSVINCQSSCTTSPEKKKGHIGMGRQLCS